MTRRGFEKLTVCGGTVHVECKITRSAVLASFGEAYSSFAQEMRLPRSTSEELRVNNHG